MKRRKRPSQTTRAWLRDVLKVEVYLDVAKLVGYLAFAVVGYPVAAGLTEGVPLALGQKEHAAPTINPRPDAPRETGFMKVLGVVVELGPVADRRNVASAENVPGSRS